MVFGKKRKRCSTANTCSAGREPGDPNLEADGSRIGRPPRSLIQVTEKKKNGGFMRDAASEDSEDIIEPEMKLNKIEFAIHEEPTTEEPAEAFGCEIPGGTRKEPLAVEDAPHSEENAGKNGQEAQQPRIQFCTVSDDANESAGNFKEKSPAEIDKEPFADNADNARLWKILQLTQENNEVMNEARNDPGNDARCSLDDVSVQRPSGPHLMEGSVVHQENRPRTIEINANNKDCAGTKQDTTEKSPRRKSRWDVSPEVNIPLSRRHKEEENNSARRRQSQWDVLPEFPLFQYYLLPPPILVDPLTWQDEHNRVPLLQESESSTDETASRANSLAPQKVASTAADSLSFPNTMPSGPPIEGNNDSAVSRHQPSHPPPPPPKKRIPPPPPPPKKRIPPPPPPKKKILWIRAFDTDGTPYYYHKDTHETTWKLPKGATCDDRMHQKKSSSSSQKPRKFDEESMMSFKALVDKIVRLIVLHFLRQAKEVTTKKQEWLIKVIVNYMVKQESVAEDFKYLMTDEAKRRIEDYTIGLMQRKMKNGGTDLWNRYSPTL